MSTLWYALDESGETQAMLVPGGMVVSRTRELASADRVAISEALCFVPSGYVALPEQLEAWVRRVNGEEGP